MGKNYQNQLKTCDPSEICFLKKKHLNFSKKSKPVVVLFTVTSWPFSKLLKTKVLTILTAVKNSSLAANGKVWWSPKAHSPELSVRWWKAPISGCIFYMIWFQSSFVGKTLYSGNFSKYSAATVKDHSCLKWHYQMKLSRGWLKTYKENLEIRCP